MTNRYSVLKCDIDDPKSLEDVGGKVKERALKGACSYFELETRLSARIVIECNPVFGTGVQILDADGEAGKVMSSSGVTWHRYLKVERSVDGLPKGLIAHKILAIINAAEEQIPEENVRGYDMILFYVREGYMPVEDDYFETLTQELVKHLQFRVPINEVQRRLLPMINLKLRPEKAAVYWEILTHRTAKKK